ncbi:MAG: SCO family protein [Chitinophagales bacterium]
MNGKFVALAVAFLIPLAFFILIDYVDILGIQGLGNGPQVNRFVPASASKTGGEGYLVNDTLWHQVPDFKFLAHTGDSITLNRFKDKVFVTDFFFTNCPSICPNMTKHLKLVQDEMKFKKFKDVMILSHTVDPDRDTLETLNTYADLYEADSSMWLFVTGDKKKLYEQARNAYFVSATEGNGGEEDFIHSEKLVLIDKYRVIRGFYDGTNLKDVQRLIVDIATVKLEYPRPKKERISPF